MLSAYNTKLALYNDCVAAKATVTDAQCTAGGFTKAATASTAFSTAKVVINTPPTPPFCPEAYAGLYLYATGDAYSSKQFKIDGSAGGWGSLTMGLLPMAALIEKSFGMIGVGKTTTDPVYKAQEQGYLATTT